MLGFLPLFYQNKNQSGDAATEKNTGIPHITNLLAQDPKQWQETSGGIKRVPKTLVFANALAEGWSKNQFEAFKQRLLEACDLGFSIRFFLVDTPVALEQSIIEKMTYGDFISCVKYIDPVPFEVFCTKNKMAQSDIAYLDDYLTQVFITNQEGIRQIDTLTFLTMHPAKRESVLAYLQHASPQVNQILNQTDMMGSGRIFSELQTKFPSAEVIQSITIKNARAVILSLTKDKNKQLYGTLPPKYYISDFDPTSSIGYLKAGKTNGISLYNCTIPIENQEILKTIEEFPLDALEELTLVFTGNVPDISAVVLAFLKKCPELKKLQLVFQTELDTKSTYILNLQSHPLLSLRIFTTNVSKFQIFSRSLTEVDTINVSADINIFNPITGKRLLDREFFFDGEQISHGFNTGPVQRFSINVQTSNRYQYCIALDPHVKHLEIMDGSCNEVLLISSGYYELKSVSISDLNVFLTRIGNYSTDFPDLEEISGLDFVKFKDINPEKIMKSPKLNTLKFKDMDIKSLCEGFDQSGWTRPVAVCCIDILEHALAHGKYIQFHIPSSAMLFYIFYHYFEKEENTLTLEDANVVCMSTIGLISRMYSCFVIAGKKFSSSKECADFLNREFLALTTSWSNNNNQTPSHPTRPQDIQLEQKDLGKENIFDPKAALNETPATKDKTFEYKAPNTQKNISDHDLFIQQLSRYLQVAKTGEQQHIPRLSDGICTVLSRLFKEKPLHEWQEHKTLIQKWNGSKPIEENVKNALEALFQRYKDTYFNRQALTQYYLGENPANYFDAKKEHLKQGALILNYNHAITVKWDKQQKLWIFYDPNDSTHKTTRTTDALVQIVKGHLGELLATENSYPSNMDIKDSIAFIRNGGLFAMTHGWQNIPPLQSNAFANNYTWHDGLLLRNAKGVPFWVSGVNHEPTRDFTMALLTHYLNQQETQKAHLQALKKSLEIMTPSSRQEVITLITQYALAHKSHEALKHTLMEALHTAPNDRHYLEQFTTWVNTPLSTEDLEGYYLGVVSAKEGGKRLIQCDSAEKTIAMRAQIKRLKGQRPVFFADSPQDLICSSPYIEQQGNQGVLKQGPGGALYQFLKEAAQHPHDTAPLLVVDFSQFSPEQIVRFNSMLDDTRRVDGTDIPKHVVIIGLMDTSHPECYRGEDFYSRFDKKDENPLSANALSKSLPVSPSPVPRQSVTNVLEFHHGSNALAKLKGSWAFEGEGLRFIEGYEHTLLKTPPQTLTIANGPWDNPLFKTYWRDFQQEHPHITLQTTEGYDWPSLTEVLKPSVADTYEHVLNPSTLAHYFSSYVIDNEKQSLCVQNGLLNEKKGQILFILLTQSISLDGFARLLHEAKEQGVWISCKAAYGVEIPLELKNHITTLPKPSELALTDIQNAPVVLIQSEQPEKTNNAFKADKIIDISEVAPHDILGGLDGRFLKDKLKFQFNTLPNRLQHWLDLSETVILTGHFQENLIDALMPMILARQKNESAKGKLIITSDDLDGFKGLSIFKDVQPPRPQRPKKPPITPTRLTQFDPDNSEHITRKFKKKRLEDVQNALKNHPHVLLTGLTGVGKTSFVEDLQNEDCHVFMGEKRLLDWVKSTEKGQNILFIDEANLADTDWSMFEGLYHTPPALFYKGEYITRLDNHKVIFAGNPSTYGGERNMPSLFEHHDHTVEFTTIPAEMIYEDMLKPLIGDKTLAKPLLDLYVRLANCSKNEVLISPREVKMMALLALSDTRYQTPEQRETVLKETAYRIGSTLVPECHRQIFDEQFKPQHLLPPTPEKLSAFIMTPSRAAIYHQMMGLLNLRSWRYLKENHLRETSAIGGMVIEGEPGQGKSELIKAILVAKGYKEAHFTHPKLLENTAENEQKIFYIMPVSMGFNDKKKLLKRAFHEGALVIIDEINSSPMMERLVNELAMGKYKGQRAKKPGFTVIGTQNPATMMSGRRIATDALKRRFIHMNLPNYTEQELLHIAKAKLPHQKKAAKAVVNAWMQQSRRAQQEHLKPAPTFREFLKVVTAEAFEGFASVFNSNDEHLHILQPMDQSNNPQPNSNPTSSAQNFGLFSRGEKGKKTGAKSGYVVKKAKHEEGEDANGDPFGFL